jgi:hypothetical protein
MTSTLGKRKCSTECSTEFTVAEIYKNENPLSWQTLHAEIKRNLQAGIDAENFVLLNTCIADVERTHPGCGGEKYGEFTLRYKDKTHTVSIGDEKTKYKDMFEFLREEYKLAQETKAKITPEMNKAYFAFQTWAPEQQRLFQTMIEQWPVSGSR